MYRGARVGPGVRPPPRSRSVRRGTAPRGRRAGRPRGRPGPGRSGSGGRARRRPSARPRDRIANSSSAWVVGRPGASGASSSGSSAARRARPAPPRRTAARTGAAPGTAGQRARSRRHRRAAAAGSGTGRPSGRAAWTAVSTASCAIRRYVVSLPPTIVTSPSGAVITACRRERSAVWHPGPAVQQRPQSGVRAEQVRSGDRYLDRAVDRVQQEVDLGIGRLRYVAAPARARPRRSARRTPGRPVPGSPSRPGAAGPAPAP